MNPNKLSSEELTKAWEKTLALLSRRDLFINELRAKLSQFEPEVCESTIQKAIALGYLGDERITVLLLEENYGKRAKSWSKVINDLVKREANPHSIALAEQCRETQSEVDLMLEILNANHYAGELSEDPKVRTASIRRASQFLMRRGFEEDDIQTALERFFNVDLNP